MLKKFKLVESLDQKVSSLSRSDQLRLCLGLTWMSKAKIMLIDEPFENLDEQNKISTKLTLKSLIAKDRIIIVASNYLDDIEDISDCNYILEHGEVILEGSINRMKSLYNCSECLVIYDDPCSSKHNISVLEKLISKHFDTHPYFDRKKIRLNHEKKYSVKLIAESKIHVIPFIEELHRLGFQFLIEPFNLKDILRKETNNFLAVTSQAIMEWP